MTKYKIMAVFGTRPEAIKMAPLVTRLAKTPEIDLKVTVTAQHREMLDQVLDLFNITPDYDLNIMTANQTLYDVTTKALLGVKEALEKESPHMILVHGDTTTTFVAGLAAFYKQIRVGHVEAGLRTGNKLSPFPEEMNRKLTGAIADLHFAPTFTAKENLLREGVEEEQIFVTGNTVIDALLATVNDKYKFPSAELEKIDFEKKKVLVVTTHRRENLGEPLRNIYTALKEVLDNHQDVEVVFPVHKNPRVREIVKEMLGGLDRVHLIDPLDYEPFVNLMNKAHLVLTDSGGLQEEAPSLGKPVLVLRDTTERPEAVEAGTVELVGTSTDKIIKACKRLLTDDEAYNSMANAVNPYGDGQASDRIVEALLYGFDSTKTKPRDFHYTF